MKTRISSILLNNFLLLPIYVRICLVRYSCIYIGGSNKGINRTSISKYNG